MESHATPFHSRQDDFVGVCAVEVEAGPDDPD